MFTWSNQERFLIYLVVLLWVCKWCRKGLLYWLLCMECFKPLHEDCSFASYDSISIFGEHDYICKKCYFKLWEGELMCTLAFTDPKLFVCCIGTNIFQIFYHYPGYVYFSPIIYWAPILTNLYRNCFLFLNMSILYIEPRKDESPISEYNIDILLLASRQLQSPAGRDQLLRRSQRKSSQSKPRHHRHLLQVLQRNQILRSLSQLQPRHLRK